MMVERSTGESHTEAPMADFMQPTAMSIKRDPSCRCCQNSHLRSPLTGLYRRSEHIDPSRIDEAAIAFTRRKARCRRSRSGDILELKNRFSLLIETRDECEKDSTLPPEPPQALFLESESPSLNVLDTKEYMDFTVVLDSGAAGHVVDSADTPGYEVTESPGSRM